MSRRWVPCALLAVVLTSCGSSVQPFAASARPAPTTTTTTTTTSVVATTTSKLKPRPESMANPAGTAVVPPEAEPEDTSSPTKVVGTGTSASCTSDAVAEAVAGGGVITFDCGPEHVTVVLDETVRIRNDKARDIVIDGGGLVTLSGAGERRLFYLNTCDRSLGAGTRCQDQTHPRLTLQNLTLADGNATGETEEGGGAVYARGGSLKVVNSRFLRNRCDQDGPDLGGAAIRAFGQKEPVYVVGSTFQNGECSNGGALSSIGTSWVVLNSVLKNNKAIGRGANPARDGEPGGGSGGALYADGNEFTVKIAGTLIEDNHANEGGGAIFFVSNDRSGTMVVEGSTLRRNPSDGFETPGLKGIFFLGATEVTITGSTIE
ncbi:hypothetical protein [Saccharothrix variisporea]|uniref:Outer membrane repeat protein n=1 Tax=Saccharothrix variisporea TaxID=543527 RepID=A0A495X4X0_9PSEU|nr:hypothetical protein [Saccharothrix variisporea]RKT68992.1 hypothetical protein DFJ66_2185 [Saccharothrix variisporea]